MSDDPAYDGTVMFKSMLAGTFWGILAACAVLWIELEALFVAQHSRSDIALWVSLIGMGIIGAPFAFFNAAIIAPGLDALKSRVPSRARLIGFGILLGVLLDYVALLLYILMSKESEDWVARLDPRNLGPLGPAALVGGAVLGLRVAWTVKPAIRHRD